MSIADSLTASLKDASPGKKRIAAIVAAGSVLALVVALASKEPEVEEKKKKESIKTVFTDQSTRAIGMDSISAQSKILTRENSRLRKRMDKLDKNMDYVSDTIRKTNAFDDKLTLLQQSIATMRKENIKLKKAVEEAKSVVVAAPSKPVQAADSGQASTDIATGQPSQIEDDYEPEINQEDAAKIFKEAETPEDNVQTGPGSKKTKAKGRQSAAIFTYSEKKSDDDDDSEDEVEDQSTYIPAGSILTGVLINGMDAPTSQGARKNPFPSTIRIQKEAILPNRFRADVRECFLVVSGYGDLSSERVYLRGETLSCITEEGGVIETRLESYAVGEDGKAGIRGRVVSKQGQIIAKSLLAGFASGVSEAFNTNPVQALSTNPGSSTQYQSVFSEQALQGGVSKGASKALDRIAQFYLDIAEGIFPVVELDAGRLVEIIMTKGTKLTVKNTKKMTKKGKK